MLHDAYFKQSLSPWGLKDSDISGNPRPKKYHLIFFFFFNIPYWPVLPDSLALWHILDLVC